MTDTAHADPAVGGEEPGSSESSALAAGLRGLRLPIVAVGLAAVAGGLLLIISGENPLSVYWSILDESFLSGSGIGRTLEKATPLVMGGLAVAFAFKAGLFNIGGQGQLLLGAAFAAWVGYNFDLPLVIHLPLALAVGGLVAALLGAIVGALKAYRGAHEVITTIMFNFVAGNLTDYLVSRDGPWNDPNGGAIARTPRIRDSAIIPTYGDIPIGFFIACGFAVLIWWLLNKTTFGFEIITTGANKHAARYAGISVNRIIILTMGISAFLAGIGGAIQSQGLFGRFEASNNAGLGFEGITIALLARTNPIAVIPSAILIGGLNASTTRLQQDFRIEPEVVSILQALILFFVAAPSVVQWLVRWRALDDEEAIHLTGGWGA